MYYRKYLEFDLYDGDSQIVYHYISQYHLDK
jgi:hypothetical protein